MTDTNNTYEIAARTKLRFDTVKGQLTVEDLWDLPLQSQTGKTNLDDIAKALHKQIKETDSTVSFVNPTQKTNDVVQVRFDLVKHVIDVKLTENAAAAEVRSKAERKQQLMGLIAQKEFEQIAGQSLEDLKAQVAAM